MLTFLVEQGHDAVGVALIFGDANFSESGVMG